MVIKNKSGEVIVDTEFMRDLNGLDLRQADFSSQALEGLDLSDADLQGATFAGADLYWLRLFRSKCRNSDFQDARLSGAVLDGADLRETDFTGAYVSWDQVGVASSMLGTDLTGAKMQMTNLIGCQYDESTRFPVEFDPHEAGMVFVSRLSPDTK